MKIGAMLDLIDAGGPGSGCNPLKGRCGKFKKAETMMLKKKGHLISLKKPGIGLPGTKETANNVLKKTKVTQNIPGSTGNITYNYTVLKGKDVSGIPKEFTDTEWNPEPPNTFHKLKGSFREVARVPVQEENRVSIVYDAGKDEDGRAVSMFVHKYRTGPTSGHVVLEEFDREGSDIIGKKQIEFGTGKAAKQFMQFRYGIKANWSKDGSKPDVE